MTVQPRQDRDFGMGRGKVFPAASAKSLLNPARRLVQSPRRTARAVGLGASDRVLELGCGPGYFSAELARCVPDGELVLYDLQLAMLELAKSRLVLDRIAFAQGDGAVLPFRAGSLDAVFIATVLGEMPDQSACIAEAARVLRPGGRLAISETRRDSDFIAHADLVRLVEPHGFTLTARRGPPWQYVATFRRA